VLGLDETILTVLNIAIIIISTLVTVVVVP